jgi:hypothetical protein
LDRYWKIKTPWQIKIPHMPIFLMKIYFFLGKSLLFRYFPPKTTSSLAFWTKMIYLIASLNALARIRVQNDVSN